MGVRRRLGLVLSVAVLAGASAVGAATAQSATPPPITREACTVAGGQISTVPGGGAICALPDGSRQPIA
ncbi:hypothetical protein [Streptomyces sp. NRRL S-87]|uniref:hypothetical protein n=1 Tax=Streptomyces sp. NRRL S-87 TaxID=1463920 RepID=UPI001F451F1B|nr:hypothetical protein [Streptomyces sp. NRRL S-87]